MKVQTKLSLVLGVITVFFVAGLLSLQAYNSYRAHSLARMKINEKNTLFDKIIKLQTASLETFAYDFSRSAVLTGLLHAGKAEAAPELIEPFLESFHVDAVWVYRTDATPVYQHNIFAAADIARLPLQDESIFKALSLRPFQSFFIETPRGYLEVMTAPLQPREDADRKTKPRGYLFAGRLWHDAYIEELSALTESTISIMPPQQAGETDEGKLVLQDTVSFTRPLLSWDRKILAQCRVSSEALFIRQFVDATRKQLLLALGFSGVVLLVLYVFFQKNLRPPLLHISQSLTRSDPSFLETIKSADSEFGNIARLIISFFSQQQKLTVEIAERVQAEEKLKAAYDAVRVREEELEASNEELLAQEEQLKNANQELMESHKELQRLATAVDQAAEGIAITDIKGNFIYVNTAYEWITGYPKEEILGQSSSMFSAEEQDSTIIKQLSTTVAGGTPWKGTIKMKKKDGEIIDTVVTISPIKDIYGNNINYVAVVRDITRELLVEKQLQQVQKMETIGTLAGGIAHDFNNILTAIIGYADISLIRLPTESPVRENLQQILTSCDRATNLVRQILAFSRKNEQERKPVQLSSIVNEVLKLLRASIPTTIEIRHTIKDFTGAVLADPVQMHQVIMNLCTNAAHAMSEKGGLLLLELSSQSITAEEAARYPETPAGEYLKLTVSDTGIGIDPKNINRIFEPFFTTKEIGKGTGMGLAVAHGIVKSHGGTITVSSRPGQGSVFHVLLPKITTAAIEPKEEKKEINRGSERILFIDDEQTIVTLGKQMLESLGYTVTALSDSREALEVFSSKPDQFDLIISDQTMPHMTGYELARRAMSIRPAIPVILCTGYSETVSAEKAKDLGIREYIMKPVDRFNLATTVRRVLDTANHV